MMMVFAVIAALTPHQQTISPAPAGTTLHYLRSNRDGTEPEHIYVHRAAPDRLAVYKMVRRCTGAALVTAAIDPVTGEATRLEAARLLPDAGSRTVGVMTFDAATATLTAELGGPTPSRERLTVPIRPWHLYDYDLGTLSVAGEQIVRRRPAEFVIGLALVWPDAARPDRFLNWIGPAQARFVRAERLRGTPTLRYDVTGVAFGAAGGGPLWLDARDGHIVEARWGRPNHDHMRDFRLRLIGREPAGAAAWTALLERHFEGCPAA